MRVTVYDKNPGPGFAQWLLKTSWLVGCWLQKLFGAVDDYHGAETWADALAWLTGRKEPLSSIQYWGHGSPGAVWLGGRALPLHGLTSLKERVTPETVVWFRTCSTFQGAKGHDFSMRLGTMLNCTVAGHTRVVGFFQGGLHTRRPGAAPSWLLDEGELSGALAAAGLRWGSNTILCVETKIPEGW